MNETRNVPRIVLLCHEEDRIDMEIIAPWLACSFDLAGVIALRETPGTLLRRVRREIRRVGPFRFLDVAAFRIFYRLCLAAHDRRWMEREVERWSATYPPARLGGVPRLLTEAANGDDVRRFISSVQPDLLLARCKAILKPEIFMLPRAGTWVLHPGICPEYRNAHGCFWALAKRDLGRVGMTLLQVDRGVDTGPMFLQASYAFDERRESHVVIQYRAVLENLDRIADVLTAAAKGIARPIAAAGRHSASWGQPWLSEYVRWKRAAKEMAG